MEERKELRMEIFTAVQENLMQSAERLLRTYQGFELILPANMIAEKPYIWVVGEGKYYVELGDSEKGVLPRIDNFLDNLKELALKFTDALAQLAMERERIRDELDKEENYVDRIEELRAELKNIDKKLGVEEE